jgi:hypothetical protein
MPLRATLALLVLMALTLGGCRDTAPRSPTQQVTLTSAADLVEALLAEGAVVTALGPADDARFPRSVHLLLVNDDTVRVAEFPSQAEAQRAARETAAPPGDLHQRDHLLVLYPGERADVLAALRAVLGPEVGGPQPR